MLQGENMQEKVLSNGDSQSWLLVKDQSLIRKYGEIELRTDYKNPETNMGDCLSSEKHGPLLLQASI